MDLPVYYDAKVLMSSFALVSFVALFLHLYKNLVAKPRKLKLTLQKQGFKGPPQALFLGNVIEIFRSMSDDKIIKSPGAPVTHNVGALIFPHFHKWMHQYGKSFVFGLGPTQTLCVNHPDVVRDLTTRKSFDIGKPKMLHKSLAPLLGNGIVVSNGNTWVHQRKILGPELYADKVKGMVNLIVDSTNLLLNSWKSKIEAVDGVIDIDIDEDIRTFSGDVISRACFGSNYSKGEEIFLKLVDLQNVIHKKLFSAGIPGISHIPTKSNRRIWALEKEVHELILQVVREREEKDTQEKDLLQMVLENTKDSGFSKAERYQYIVDNCKNIYLAGYETTAITAIWCLMLLASNQDWQDRVRAEVVQVCRGQVPDADMARQMKLLTMVIHETLRLYPPTVILGREAFVDAKLGDFIMPEGTNIWVYVATLHTDPEIWGEDSYKFNPERFANGIAGACKNPHLYMPFGFGSRVCLGQNLAVMELRIMLSLILSNFSLSISPKYVHSPVLKLVIEPKHGVHLLVEKLKNLNMEFAS